MYARTAEDIKAEIFLESRSFDDLRTSIEQTPYIGRDYAEMAHCGSSSAQSDSLLSCQLDLVVLPTTYWSKDSCALRYAEIEFSVLRKFSDMSHVISLMRLTIHFNNIRSGK
jgi:hypothetical protein